MLGGRESQPRRGRALLLEPEQPLEGAGGRLAAALVLGAGRAGRRSDPQPLHGVLRAGLFEVRAAGAGAGQSEPVLVARAGHQVDVRLLETGGVSGPAAASGSPGTLR